MAKDLSGGRSSAEWAASHETDSREGLVVQLVLEIRAGQNAVEQLDEAAVELMGINRTDGRCIDIIDRRGPLSAGELAREAGLTTGAVTAVLDRLERKGYVRRLPDTGDRRRVLVEITDRARAASLEVYGPLKEKSQQFIERLTDDDLRLLIEFSRISREINEQRAAEVRARLKLKGSRPVPDGGGSSGRAGRARPGRASADGGAPRAS